jgi:hypothetical protein
VGHNETSDNLDHIFTINSDAIYIIIIIILLYLYNSLSCVCVSPILFDDAVNSSGYVLSKDEIIKAWRIGKGFATKELGH